MATLSRKSEAVELENTLESVENYQALFTEFLFEEEQIEILISKFIKREIILTDINNIKKRIQAFSIFEIPIQKRNLFICNNASLIFNKYPKEMISVFDGLVKKHGAKEAFERLLEYPETIRLEMVKEEVVQRFDELFPEVRKIMYYRWGLDDGIIKTLDETAYKFGVSRNRVLQIELKWLKRRKSFPKKRV